MNTGNPDTMNKIHLILFIMTKINFNDTDLLVFITNYADGKIAIMLIEEETNEPYCTATVNTPITLYDNEVVIKHYSENVGVYEALVNAKVIAPAHRYTSSGYINRIPVCKLLIEKEITIKPNKDFDNEQATSILN